MLRLDGLEELAKLYYLSNAFFEEEDFLAYRPGGYHPVTLGDTLKDGRYKIYHKLGWGGFSTVWVAKDYETEEWVSIKIPRADAPHHCRELEISWALTDAWMEKDYSSPLVVHLFDSFVHEGPNGSHQCLVFELLGPTVDMEVANAHHFKERLETDTIIGASSQILEALTFMHEAGYAHGDLSARNIAFYSPHLYQLSEEKLLEALGPPKSEKVTRLDGSPPHYGVPTEMVQSARWPGWPLEEDDDEDYQICLIDLGEAFHRDAIPKKLAAPPAMLAPEQVLDDKFDHRQDLWRAGLTIYYLICGSLPCHRWGSIASLIVSMIMVIEDLPPQWESKCKQLVDEAKARKASGFEDDSDTWRNDLNYRLEKKFDEKVHEPDLKRLLPVIRGLTRLLPENRISASEALAMIQEIEKSREESRTEEEENRGEDNRDGEDEREEEDN